MSSARSRHDFGSLHPGMGLSFLNGGDDSHWLFADTLLSLKFLRFQNNRRKLVLAIGSLCHSFFGISVTLGVHAFYGRLRRRYLRCQAVIHRCPAALIRFPRPSCDVSYPVAGATCTVHSTALPARRTASLQKPWLINY